MRRIALVSVLVATAALFFVGCEIDPEVDLEPFDLLEPVDNAVIDVAGDLPVLIDFEPTEAPPFMRNYEISYYFIYGPVNANLTNESLHTVGPVAGGRNVIGGEAIVDYTGLELDELLLRAIATSLGYETGQTVRVQWTVRASLTSIRFEGEQYASTSRVLEYVLTAPAVN